MRARFSSREMCAKITKHDLPGAGTAAREDHRITRAVTRTSLLPTPRPRIPAVGAIAVHAPAPVTRKLKAYFRCVQSQQDRRTNLRTYAENANAFSDLRRLRTAPYERKEKFRPAFFYRSHRYFSGIILQFHSFGSTAGKPECT